MSDDQDWDDESRNDLRDALRSTVRGGLRLANDDRAGILEVCREVYIEDESPQNEWDVFIRFATDEFDRAASLLTSEQANWPDETDCDRLDRVEADLRNRGILLWQVSPCCDTCTGAELPDRIDDIDRRHSGFREQVRGYAFFIDQNMAEMLADDSQLSVYLAYGWFPPDDSNVAPGTYQTNALGIAREVCDCLRDHGFEVDWDGDFSRKIGISLNWQRRSMLK